MRGAATAIVLVLTTSALLAQGIRGVPRLELPQPPQPPRERDAEPVFRAAVTRVEVSAVVLDRDGRPVPGSRRRTSR